MPAPTAIEVFVDNTEYSRYEADHDTINVSLTASGGAPYSSTPIVVDLVKARRSRDAVVASQTVTLSTMIDPAQATASFHLPDIVDADLINLVRHGNYFVRATYEATPATTIIGSGFDGSVIVNAPPGTVGNTYSVEVVTPSGDNPLLVSFAANTLTISLATSAGVPVNPQNLAITIATTINAFGSVLTNPYFTATYTGNGNDPIISNSSPTLMTGGTNEVVAITPDFAVRIITVARFRREWLFGISLASTQILTTKQGPSNITGISIVEISSDHPPGFGDLTYNINSSYPSNAIVSIGSGTDGTVQLTAVNAYQGQAGNSFSTQVIVPSGNNPLTANLVGNTVVVSLATVAGVATGNTATLVAAAINALANFDAVASGTGASLLTVAEAVKAFTGGVTVTVRTLSWKNGPAVSITAPGTYVLPAGNSSAAASLLACNGGQKSFSKDYIVVRVASILALPTTSQTDIILLEKQQMDDETLARYLDAAIAYLENDFLNIFLEPTIVTTDRDPTTIQFTSGVNAPIPIYVEQDFDVLTGPLTYFYPTSPGWVQVQTPFMGLLRVDSLFGAVANTRVIDIDLEWIEHYHKGGLIQLVPFNQSTAFNYIGLIWVNTLRGSTEVPNFWHFTLVAGLRDTPAELIEYIGKYAAINALTAIAAAFRPGLGSMSLSRDGVSQSLSFNTQAMYGIYTGAIQSYKDWMKERQPAIRANYRGPMLRVL